MEPYTVQAEYSFQGENNDELRFQKGDIITVTQREDGGWWEGTLNEMTGWFPSNYVKEYKGKWSLACNWCERWNNQLVSQPHFRSWRRSEHQRKSKRIDRLCWTTYWKVSRPMWPRFVACWKIFWNHWKRVKCKWHIPILLTPILIGTFTLSHLQSEFGRVCSIAGQFRWSGWNARRPARINGKL